MPKILKYILNALFLPIYYIFYLSPRKKNIWIFGTFGGKKFAENSKYLFIYVKRNHPDIRPIWLTRELRILKDLRQKGYEAYKTFSWKGFFYSMLASCVIVNNVIDDVNKFVIAGAKKIQLWHGIPIKKIGYKGKNSFFKFLVRARNKILPFVRPDWDMLIATSKENKKYMSSYFLVKENRVPITGYPRNDALFDAPWLEDNKCYQLDDIRSKISFKYVFSYLPTHRMHGKKKIDLFGIYGFKIVEVEEVLKNFNAILIIKPHFNDRKFNLLISEKKIQRIYNFSDDELPDVYPLLRKTDLLITDYSGLSLEYLLLEKPIIFAPFDIDEYEREWGFAYDYNEVTPGPKARNWPEVFNYIKQALSRDDWKEKREEVRQRFQAFKDNKNSERVFRAIKEALGQ